MRLDDDDVNVQKEEKNKYFIGAAVLVVSLFVLLIFGIVLFVNRDTVFGKQKTKQQNATKMEEAVSELEEEKASVNLELSDLISGSTLVSDDLDIWEEYQPEPEDEATTQPTEEKSEETDITKDGSHTLVTYSDGSEEWLLISPYLPANEYDTTCLMSRDDRMFYYTEGEKTSYMGIDISKEDGYVDFNKVKKDGIEFVMIRVGARGYGSGQLSLDDCFADNIKRATDAGLEVGVYFDSQAVTEEEACEEADMVVEHLEGYTISYPVAFVMHGVQNDTARIDALTKEEKTRIAKTFITKIRDAGYNSILYGNKEWILTKVNYAALSDQDIWLSQEKDIPDYPYRFSIWQYSTKGTVDGVSGTANLNISFIDYSSK